MFKRCNSEPSSTTSATLSTPSRVNSEDDAMEILAELYQLLESYSPTWYTEEHRRRAQLALQRRDTRSLQRQKAH